MPSASSRAPHAAWASPSKGEQGFADGNGEPHLPFPCLFPLSIGVGEDCNIPWRSKSRIMAKKPSAGTDADAPTPAAEKAPADASSGKEPKKPKEPRAKTAPDGEKAPAAEKK